MAQNNKKKPSRSGGGGKGSASGARQGGGGANSKNPAKTRAGKAKAAKAPRRREIAAFVCFFLTIFTLISYFSADGAFIGFFSGLVKGLVGAGFFAMAPALLLSAAILCFHRGRPVRLRVACALLLTVAIGALVHLSVSEAGKYEIKLDMLASLWRDGKALEAGGAVAGALSVIFTWLFAKVGAAIVFSCMTLFLLLAAINKTVAGIIDAYRTRERREYVPEPEPERPPRREPPPPKRKKVIDIPIDYDVKTEPENDNLPSGGVLNKIESRTRELEQLAAESIESAGAGGGSGNGGETADAGADADADEPEIEDTPLDIPFMESSRSRAAAERAAAEKEKKAAAEASSASGNPAAPASDNPADAPVSRAKKEKTAEPLTFEPVGFDHKATYNFPPIDLLSAGAPGSRIDGSEEIRVNSERLEAAFRSFGVNVTISNATRGPAVTRYEAELEAGVKLNKLTSLADDIALSLGKSGVRIAAMPNKISTVGIEVPNKHISTVYLREIIETPEFKRAKAKLTFAVGMDISGEAIVGSISKMPHMLVAGTTGSGKSVCLNSLILSILYKATPDDVRFIMIDPKMVEFKVYNNIPHLLVPVVTDVKKAAGALQWAVVEMMKRYSLFSETNARDLEGYNQIARKKEDRDILPQIIVVIDELADLMMMAAKEVEESICRVAQMGRAAGVHLIIATQSPRADVITGLMKANIPSRIALKVSSALESRIILDAGGNADKLVGNGDMLFAPIGTTKPLRVQGTWVSDAERERVVDYINECGQSQYSEEVMDEIEKAAADKASGDKSKDDPDGMDCDELLPQAVDVIFETGQGQVSVSMLQRRLKLGYSRAARIVDQLEKMGIVGPFEGSKPRSLLVTREQWRQMQYINGVAPMESLFDEPVVSVD